jgi:inward rectifier potassium channel
MALNSYSNLLLHVVRTRRSNRQELQRQHGLLSRRNQSAWSHWREPYVLALAIPWPGFLLLISTQYVVINLVFAGLYLLDPGGIAGNSGDGPHSQLAQAFFFSVQTLGAIGYGALYPQSLLTNLLVTAESLTGLLFIAITTGLAFARFARSNARIRFSQQAVIHTYNGVPTLSFRLANERGNSIRDARLQAFLAVDEISSEGHRLRRLKPLQLERDRSVALVLVWTAMHRIDATSPLHGLDNQALRACNAELLVSLSGVDETLERPLHAHANWGHEQIRYGFCLADMLASRQIHWSAFDQLRPCPLPSLS